MTPNSGVNSPYAEPIAMKNIVYYLRPNQKTTFVKTLELLWTGNFLMCTVFPLLILP